MLKKAGALYFLPVCPKVAGEWAAERRTAARSRDKVSLLFSVRVEYESVGVEYGSSTSL